MKEDYKIILLTRGRVDKQKTLENLPILIKKLITIVCYPGEKQQHLKNWGGMVEGVVEHSKQCKNLGDIRHWVMVNYKDYNIIFLDDNLSFSCRYDIINRNFSLKNKIYNIKNNFSEEIKIEIFIEMFYWIISKLRKGYGISGISSRSGNNRKTKEEEENTRIFAIWGINSKKYFEVGNFFNKKGISSKEDFYVELSFLTNGIKIISNNCFAFDKVSGANQNGGCSTYRTLEYSNNCSINLKNEFPDFVRLTEKESNNWGGDFNGKRIEVICQWKKAFNSSFKNKKYE